jgi:hypothetical protein
VDGEIEPASPDYVARLWAERWSGEPVISGRREYRLADVEGLAWRSSDGRLAGLVTGTDGIPLRDMWELEAAVTSGRAAPSFRLAERGCYNRCCEGFRRTHPR